MLRVALIDTYRNNISRKRKELIKLQSDRAGEAKKINNLSQKRNLTKQVMTRTKSISILKTKAREIERAEKTLVTIEKKLAEIDNKIAKKSKDIADEEIKLRKAEEREEKIKIMEGEKQMKLINKKLGEHSDLHLQTQEMLTQLQQIPEKITVLFMASNPINATQLRLDEEAREIGEMIRKSDYRNSVSFVTKWAVRPQDVLQSINEEQPTIIHFSGHGSDEDEIVFQNSQGQARLVSKEAIIQTMMSSSDTIRVVFFNTCFSYGQAEAVVKHVDAAIGMKTSIGDDAARNFSAQFYSAIGFGLSLKKAFQQAKARLMLEGIDEEDTPELYIKDGLNAKEIIIVKP